MAGFSQGYSVNASENGDFNLGCESYPVSKMTELQRKPKGDGPGRPIKEWICRTYLFIAAPDNR